MSVKILHIITRLDTGGSATNTIETVARLDPKKYQVKLFFGKTYDPDKKILKLLQEKNIVYQYLPNLIRSVQPLKDMQVLWNLYVLIKKEKYEVVHTHSSKAGILGRWAAKFAGVRCIIHTPHGHVFYGYFNKFWNRIFIWVEKISAMITDKIITLTHKGMEEHIQFGIAKTEKFVPIYSGIDIESYRDQKMDVVMKRKEWGIHPKAFVFGCVARLDIVKGNEYLVEAFVDVHKKIPEAQLVLVGDGDQRARIEKKIEQYQLQKCVVLLGERDDVEVFLQLIDVFVLASLNEGMGRVILEAMSCGKSVIASEVGGIPELVEDGINGFLFPVKDIQKLSECMLKIFSQPTLINTFGQCNREKVKEKFSMGKMVEDIECLYESLLEERCS